MSLIKVSFLNMFRRKSRTLLAMTGVIIGIAALTILIALVDGIQLQATDTIGKLQGIYVYSKTVPDPSMDMISTSYENKLKTIPGVNKVIPELYHNIGRIDDKKLTLSFTDQKIMYGIEPSQFSDSSYSALISKLTKGRALKAGDKGVVMITKKMSEDYKKGVGEKINIDGKRFEIIGIFEMSSDLGGSPIFANIDDVRTMYQLSENKISAYYVIPNAGTNAVNLAKIIKFKFDKLQAQGQQEMMAQVDSILGNLKLLAIVVSIVSAIVAGIGVINTMLMSVMERTKEIGTLKAVGWTSTDVLKIILYESMFIGMLGGILGLLFGWLVCLAVTQFVGITTVVGLNLIIQNFIFGTLLGVIGGLYPAKVASKLDPIEALRSE